MNATGESSRSEGSPEAAHGIAAWNFDGNRMDLVDPIFTNLYHSFDLGGSCICRKTAALDPIYKDAARCCPGAQRKVSQTPDRS
jgi:hypothetical protein